MQEMWETQVRCLGQEDPLEEEMANHSSILAWKIPWIEEPGGLQSVGSKRVRHKWARAFPYWDGALPHYFTKHWFPSRAKMNTQSQGGLPPPSPLPTGLSIHLSCEADHLTVLHIIICSCNYLKYDYWAIF